ncbi:MAG: 2-amino-4-hydroxy-6-hydroxymethyldihydropteridine diphosphokinase [Alphaproteobacteria bacterium]|nr:2-amino-4-hydroxy-6-hydroxymethyldihydropteridine diphosphokinase [Alphaproteobacteria bacterium]
MIYVALGANMPSPVGAPAITLARAVEALPRHGVQVVAVSPFYRSPAWPDPSEPAYVNAVAEVRTRLGPAVLLRALLAVEKSFGRVRKRANEPRVLDLDLIDFGGLISDAEHLMLPHPRMHERAFVLRPLADLAPGWRHPDTGQSVSELLGIVGEVGLEPMEHA